MKPTRRFLAGAVMAGTLLAGAACDQGPTPLAAPEATGDGDVITPSFARQPKSDVCHRTEGSSDYILISVADPAVDSHLAHGDGRVGDPVPESAGMVFDAGCAPVSAVVLYLVGAQVYQATSAGAAQTLAYQYSTNEAPGGGHALLPVDLQGDGAGADDAGISIGLTIGDNVVDLRPGTDANGNFPVPNYGLHLFFNATGVSYNPARCGAGIAGDLTVTVADGSAAFATVAAGSLVQSYTTSNLPGGSCLIGATAGGAGSFTIGGYAVAVTALSEHGVISCGGPGCIGGDPDPSMTVTLAVTPAP